MEEKELIDELEKLAKEENLFRLEVRICREYKDQPFCIVIRKDK